MISCPLWITVTVVPELSTTEIGSVKVGLLISWLSVWLTVRTGGIVSKTILESLKKSVMKN